MLQLLTINAAIFFGVTLVCVILYTVKSIVIVKYSTFSGALITALAFGVNTIAVKLTADASLIMSIPYTVIANFLGVYIAKFILHKVTKDRLWRISCSIPTKKGIDTASITTKLAEYNIEHNIIPYNGGNIIDIFSKTQGESELIKEIITTNNIKYTVYEIDKTL